MKLWCPAHLKTLPIRELPPPVLKKVLKLPKHLGSNPRLISGRASTSGLLRRARLTMFGVMWCQVYNWEKMPGRVEARARQGDEERYAKRIYAHRIYAIWHSSLNLSSGYFKTSAKVFSPARKSP